MMGNIEILKRYLSQYYRARRRQATLTKRLADIRLRLKYPADFGGEQPEPSPALAIRLAEIEDRLRRNVDAESAAILNIMDMLDYFPSDSPEREIMELRHIDCRSWEFIEREVCFSRAQCMRIYTAALDTLASYARVQTILSDYRARIRRDAEPF